jgi:hypothetical protein
MSTAADWSAALGIWFVATIGLCRAAPPQQIGNWVLNCSGGSGPCLMRADKRFFDSAGLTGDLEIQAAGKNLVPVLALRGLSAEMLTAAASFAGRIKANIQFAGGPRQELDCAATGSGYFCVPTGPAAEKLAVALPRARAVTVRVTGSMAGTKPLSSGDRTLDLSGTKEALARLRAVGPTQLAAPVAASGPPSPAGMMAMADKALREAGYQNGLADLQRLLGQYLKK